MVKRVVGALAIAALLVCVGLTGAAMAQEAETSATAMVEEVGNVVCPVCNSMIDENNMVTVEYAGKVYNVCCADCKEEFMNDPDTYSALADAQVAAIVASEAAEEKATMEMKEEAADLEE